MKNCSNCNTTFDGYGLKCHSCTLQETIKKENEKNRKQNELIHREKAAAADREARMHREQMQQIANQQQRMAEQQQEMAREHSLIENAKLNELQKQTRLIEEQSISTQEAFIDGCNIKSLHFLILYDNNASFSFNNPYLTSKLNKEYNDGVNKRISEVFTDKAIWLNALLSRISDIAIEKQQLFLKLQEKINNDMDGQFYEHIELNFNGINVFFGTLVINLAVEINEASGELTFKENKHGALTNFSEARDYFNSTFDFIRTLNVVNDTNIKLSRLEIILSKKIKDYSVLLDYQQKDNADLHFMNARIIAGYLITGYAFYLLFFAGLGIFNILLFFGVFGLAALIGGDDWELKKGYNINEGRENLVKLNNFLRKTQDKLQGKIEEEKPITIEDKRVTLKESIGAATQSKNNFTTKNIVISFSILASIFIFYFIFKSNISNVDAQDKIASNVPEEVLTFIERKNNCNYFMNEPPYDNERNKFLRENIMKFCPGTDRDLATLKSKYSSDKLVMEKLSTFISIDLIETGPDVGKSYEEFKNKLISSKWQPWEFNPVNNFSPPSPEVMICDEGYCDSYFINRQKNFILRVTYKICGSNLIGTCPGFEDSFLMIDDFETINLDEANRLNKITKEHFE